MSDVHVFDTFSVSSEGTRKGVLVASMAFCDFEVTVMHPTFLRP